MAKYFNLIIFIALAVILYLFIPSIYQEFKYIFLTTSDKEVVTRVKSNELNQNKYIEAASTEYSIIIPKIGANSIVIANVDPNDALSVKLALNKGVAQVLNTTKPGDKGNVYYLAHFPESKWPVARYNSEFFLLHHLQVGDSIFVVRSNVIYEYSVISLEVRDGFDNAYNIGNKSDSLLHIIGGWPHGTTLNKFVVTAELIPKLYGR